MKVFYLNENGGNVIDIENDLDTFYDLINCDCIDIVERKCGDTYFNIICDDEGLLKDDPRVSAVDKANVPMLVGNLIFIHTDEDGNTIGITDEDAAVLIDHLVMFFAKKRDGRTTINRGIVLDY